MRKSPYVSRLLPLHQWKKATVNCARDITIKVWIWSYLCTQTEMSARIHIQIKYNSDVTRVYKVGVIIGRQSRYVTFCVWKSSWPRSGGYPGHLRSQSRLRKPAYRYRHGLVMRSVDQRKDRCWFVVYWNISVLWNDLLGIFLSLRCRSCCRYDIW